MSDVGGAQPGALVTETVISREVVAAIGAHAASATPGVVRLEATVGGLLAGLGRSARQRIAGITPAPATGTSATVSGGLARLRVEVAVSGARPVPVTAAAVQRSVARAVIDGTGLLVTGVHVAVLDVVLSDGRPGRPAGGRPPAPGPVPGPVPGEAQGQAQGAAGPAAARPNGTRAATCAAVLAAVRSVPGLRPAGPALPQRAGWVPWDPGVLAVSLADSALEVQLAATLLPLPPLLDRAAAAVRAATAGTRWGALPHRLAVTALDAGALGEPREPGELREPGKPGGLGPPGAAGPSGRAAGPRDDASPPGRDE